MYRPNVKRNKKEPLHTIQKLNLLLLIILNLLANGNNCNWLQR